MLSTLSTRYAARVRASGFAVPSSRATNAWGGAVSVLGGTAAISAAADHSGTAAITVPLASAGATRGTETVRNQQINSMKTGRPPRAVPR